MISKFEQISLKPGFMKHNGGLFFRNISETEYEFKSIINESHLNAAGITHGGYLAALIDAGAGTSAHRSANNAPCVTISLDLKFIGSSKTGDEILGKTSGKDKKDNIKVKLIKIRKLPDIKFLLICALYFLQGKFFFRQKIISLKYNNVV